MSLLTATKLKEDCGKFKTEDNEIDLVRLVVSDPKTRRVVSSAIVTLGEDVDEKRLENKLDYLYGSIVPESMTYLYGSVVPESITHFEEEERRYLDVLLVSAIAVIKVINHNGLVNVIRSRCNMRIWKPLTLIQQFSTISFFMTCFMI